jgi:D-alanine transfer protein
VARDSEGAGKVARDASPERPARGRQSPLTRSPRLVALLIALLVVGIAVGVAEMWAQWLERRYVHGLAPQQFLQKNQGRALQRAAFQQPDLLPLYGSSELELLDDPYHPSNFFRHYPTGFTVFPVGNIGTTTLIMVQQLAAIGPDARGRKVVFSLSPYWYYQLKNYAEEYAGNFSALRAGELIFGVHLSQGLKRQVARQMLRYPTTLESRPLLQLAVRRLADDSPLSRLIYGAFWPLGQLQNWVLRLQDHWESVAYIWKQKGLALSPPRRSSELDWPSLLVQAERDFAKHNGNNPFGFDNRWYERRFTRTLERNTLTNETFRAGLAASPEWTDLKLLLQVANELGAQPLILCAPSPGLFYDYLGIGRAPRDGYYQELERVASAYGVPVLSFADHDQDRYFIRDPAAHFSEKGWAYFDRALDAFYHGALK